MISTMKEDEGMFSSRLRRCRRRSFESMLYNGDWHAPLLKALNQALTDVNTPETRTLISSFMETISDKDECVHLIEKTIKSPCGVKPQIIVDCLNEGMLHDSFEYRTEGDSIHIKTTIRGSRTYADDYVNEEIRQALSGAKILAYNIRI